MRICTIGRFVFILISVLVQPTHLLYSQSSAINGNVTDNFGVPLPGVNILITGTSVGVITDVMGNFRLWVDQFPVTLRASFIGFREERVVIEKAPDSSIFIKLTPITYMSSDIVVAASRGAELQTRVPQSVAVIPSTEISSRNALTLNDALQYVPGIQIAGNQINIRGASGFSYGVGSRVTLLLDGVPILGADTGDIRFDGLPMMMIERVEIIKGPGSALYGSGALGGIINLITRSYPEKTETYIRSFYGATEPVGYKRWRDGWNKGNDWRPFGGTMVTVAGPLNNNSGMWVNALYRNQSGWLEDQQEYGAELSGKYINRLKNGRFETYFGYRRAYRETYLYWDGLDNPLSIGRVSLGAGTSSGGGNTVSEVSSLQPTLILTKGDFVMTSRLRLLVGRGFGVNTEGNLYNRPPNVAARYGGDFQVNWIPNSSSQVIVGAMHDGNAIFSDFYLKADSTKFRAQPESGIFFQAKQKVRKLETVLGVRYDSYKIDDASRTERLSPKVSMVYEITPAFLLRASAGGGFRVPSVAERFIKNNDYLPLEPNPALLPETSISYEGGIRSFFSVTGAISGQLDFSMFWNEYQRLVEPKFDASLEAFQFKNLTDARIRGMESVVELGTRNREIFFRFGYTYLDPLDLDENKPLVFRNNHMINTSAGATVFGWKLGADYRFISKPERVDSDFSKFIEDAEVTVPIHVVDARVQRSFNFQQIKGNFSIISRNVNRYYYVERPAILAQPRNYQFQLELMF